MTMGAATLPLSHQPVNFRPARPFAVSRQQMRAGSPWKCTRCARLGHPALQPLLLREEGQHRIVGARCPPSPDRATRGRPAPRQNSGRTYPADRTPGSEGLAQAAPIGHLPAGFLP